MKSLLCFLVPLALPLLESLGYGQEVVRRESWHAGSLGGALFNMIIFALVGIGLAIVGYKLFDRCTPGDLTKEILENKNTAAALVASAVILGVCIIVAASMIG